MAFSDGSAFMHSSPFVYRKIIDFDIKINLRYYEDETFVLRIQNMNDGESKKLKICRKGTDNENS